MKQFLESNLDMTLTEYLPLLQERIMTATSYHGIKTLKNPLDFWVYQELIYEIQPDVLVEIGTRFGGSTLAFAHLLDSIGKGRIISIDIDHRDVAEKVRRHPRVSLIESDAVAVFERVRELVGASGRVFIVEDSSHSFENTLAVLEHYSTLSQVGDYIVVEDSICHHGLNVGPNPGPMEAIEAFVSNSSRFESVREQESFLITWNPKGYLRRVY